MPKNEPPADEIDWSLTTWEGSRREQMRRWAALPLEQTIQAIEDMEELMEQFRKMHEAGRISTAPPAQTVPAEGNTEAVHQATVPYDSADE